MISVVEKICSIKGALDELAAFQQGEQDKTQSTYLAKQAIGFLETALWFLLRNDGNDKGKP